MSLEVGAVVEGTVTGIASFGAFVELPGGQTGLVHISEIADTFVTDVREHVQDREKVQVKILGLNEKGKYDLSLRRAKTPDPGPTEPPPLPRSRRGGSRRGHGEQTGDSRFEDLLSRFKKESDERQLDIKRNTEARRGRGRGR